MKKFFLFLFSFCCAAMLFAQQDKGQVEAKGVGTNRDEAIQDALRNAVGKAVGVYVKSETQVENFMVLKDAISTQSEGYVSSYDIIKETPLKSTYEVDIKATVSLAPLKQNAAMLEQFIGGLRFLVLYDDRNLDAAQVSPYEFAYERFNEKLIENNIRYVEKSRFDALKKEAAGILGKDTSEATYVQKLGLFADAQFIIFIKSVNIRTEEKTSGLQNTKVIIEAKAYDNCTAEGLGTVVFEGDWKLMPDKSEAVRQSITNAIQNGYDRMMFLFNKRVGGWINGAPYELRFYGMGTPRNLRELINKLKSSSDFGGSLEPVLTQDFIKINCTYKKKPYDMYNTVLDMADAIPDLKAKVIDAQLQYGRQISFAPQGTPVQDAVDLSKINKK